MKLFIRSKLTVATHFMFFFIFSHGWFGSADESEDVFEEADGIDLDGLDEDDEEENESEDDIPDTGAATLVAPPLEVQLEEESHPGNDSEEEEEEEESEDAKKLTKRAKKRLKAQR